HRLLPPREAAQSGGFARRRLHHLLLPAQDPRRIGRLDPRGRDLRRRARPGPDGLSGGRRATATTIGRSPHGIGNGSMSSETSGLPKPPPFITRDRLADGSLLATWRAKAPPGTTRTAAEP